MNNNLANLVMVILGPDWLLWLASAVVAALIVWAAWPILVSVRRAKGLAESGGASARMFRRSSCGSEMHLVSVDKPVQVQRREDGVWVLDGMACGVVVRWCRPDGGVHHSRPEEALLWIDDVEDIRRGRKQIQDQLNELARVQAQLVARVPTLTGAADRDY